MIGRKLLDKYEIVRVIGQGGMGTVYEAREIATARPVAIKWMQELALPADDPLMLRFKQEARIASTLSSPHITPMFELARDAQTGVPFQVMELLSGEDVRSCVERRGPLPPEVALRIAAQACAGLAAAHGAGVIHRDIKPDNLFLARAPSDDSGALVVKLLDFGIAKVREAPNRDGAPSAFTVPSAPMTQSGQVVGTPLFMAPEQIGGSRSVDARCDVYSMGVTLYAMLVGAPPHADKKSFVKVLHAIAHGPTLPIQNEAPSVPADVAAIVDKARSKEPSDRYNDAQALHDALSRLLPEGSALREDMLPPVNKDRPRVVAVTVGTDPNARTTPAPVESRRVPVDAQTITAPIPVKESSLRPGVLVAVGVALALIAALAVALAR